MPLAQKIQDSNFENFGKLFVVQSTCLDGSRGFSLVGVVVIGVEGVKVVGVVVRMLKMLREAIVALMLMAGSVL